MSGDMVQVLSKLKKAGRWQRLAWSTQDFEKFGMTAYALLSAVNTLLEKGIIQIKEMDNVKMIKVVNEEVVETRSIC